jgi:hypothetical protein
MAMIPSLGSDGYRHDSKWFWHFTLAHFIKFHTSALESSDQLRGMA